MRMQEASTSRMYDVWSWFYDRTFGALVKNRQVRAVHQLRMKPGDRVLDIGVGTGMCLPLYPRHVTVVGMDLSAGMLAKAKDKCRESDLSHCRLIRADAMLPPFADHSFDHVLITHTISVVSDPAKLVAWASRLVKPGGQVIILNHFQSTKPVIAWFERVLNPVFVKIGWRSDIALEEVLRGGTLHVDYQFKTGLIDLWQIVVLTPHKPRRQAAPAAANQEVPSGRWAVDGR